MKLLLNLVACIGLFVGVGSGQNQALSLQPTPLGSVCGAACDACGVVKEGLRRLAASKVGKLKRLSVCWFLRILRNLLIGCVAFGLNCRRRTPRTRFSSARKRLASIRMRSMRSQLKRHDNEMRGQLATTLPLTEPVIWERGSSGMRIRSHASTP